MKKFKLLFTVLCLFAITLVSAQKIKHDGKTYKVKKEKIFLDGN